MANRHYSEQVNAHRNASTKTHNPRTVERHPAHRGPRGEPTEPPAGLGPDPLTATATAVTNPTYRFWVDDGAGWTVTRE